MPRIQMTPMVRFALYFLRVYLILLLGLLLFVIYALDHPFGAQVGITPAPFAHSLEVFDAVDKAT